MATGLVKWWRARFLAGYKQFSVVGGNTEGSDSEELLASVATPCTGSSPPPPPLDSSRSVLPTESSQLGIDGSISSAPPVTGNDERPTSSTTTTKQLSFEEFECDVSVADGDRRRQEFSFTLYDFDGHGKITKDDIAGLVTTIYDTLGASIQVPPCGSKTIKVKLTVSPDQRAGTTVAAGGQTRATNTTIATNTNATNTTNAHACQNASQEATTTTTTTTTTGTSVAIATNWTPMTTTATPMVTMTAGPSSTTSPSSMLTTAPTTTTTMVTATLMPTPATNSSSCCHMKHASPCGRHTVATHAAHGSRRVFRRRRVPTRHRCQQREAETYSEEDAENARSNRIKQEELRRRIGPVPPAHLPLPCSNSSEGDVSDDSDTSPAFSPFTPLLTTNQRKRSGALQRQQLLEIIQANMEKNNLSFHTPRKRHQNEPLRIPSRSPQVEPSGVHQGTTPSSYNQVYRPPSEFRQQPSLMTTTATTTMTTPTTSTMVTPPAATMAAATIAYHKPIQESPHHAQVFPKLATKTRGNLRKSRVQHGIQRNIVTQTARPYVQQPHVVTRRNVVNPIVHNQQPPRATSPVVTRNVVNVMPNNVQATTITTAAAGPTSTTTTTSTTMLMNQSINNHNNVQRSETTQYVQSPQPCGKASKKHQLKHATREQDQARAMAQVVRWLEREFSQNAAVAASTDRRHVHEHIHHHYHHYHAEALV